MATVESYVKPLWLYRYRSVSVASLDRELDAIEKGYLFCATYGKLNDPMEGLFTSSRGLRESENYYAIKNEIIGEKAQIGMCSFSEVYNHDLMWAHYADQFRGICIAYSLPRLLKRLGEAVTFVRMFYNERMPTIHRVHRSSKQPNELAKMVLSYKNYRWLYEREWRMFAEPGRTYYRDRSCVSRVYLGSRMKHDDREEIMERLCRLGIKVSNMRIGEYAISFTSGR